MRSKAPGGGRRWRRLVLFVFLLALVAAVWFEGRTSTVQSLVLSRMARGFTYHLEPGPSDSIAFPVTGPFPIRRGFTRIPAITDSLTRVGFVVREQARSSPAMLRLSDWGLPLLYHERPQASLSLLDRTGRTVYAVSYPQRVYESFEQMPDLVVNALLFIENRELASLDHPYRNPAVEWDRLAKAAFDQGVDKIFGGRPRAGGSTLATQIEKFRHSPEGRTADAEEKLRQIAAASLRSYLDGRSTLGRRREIVLDYVNSVPLAAAPSFGEVIGLGDGLWAWYDLEFPSVNAALSRISGMEAVPDSEAVLVFKHVLSLFVAQKRPSWYLLGGREALARDTDSYLRLLARAGILSPEFRDAATAAPLTFRTTPAVPPRPLYIDRKAANAIRTRLRALLGLPQLYDLDRIDLAAVTTLDGAVQTELARTLVRLRERAFADSLKLIGYRLLERGDPAGVVYSFTLYEATPQGNLLRLQADNLDQPLDINEGVKLDLGSTAKLRTFVNYLDVVARLHLGYAGASRDSLRADLGRARDPIRRWVLERALSGADTSLAGTLDAALARRYSGSTDERFFTGGGLHSFSNFTREEDGQVFTVREALQKSVNLVFIRLMRDLVRYYETEIPGYEPAALSDPQHPARAEYLRRFADREGREFLLGFYRKYAELDSTAIVDAVLEEARATRASHAAVYRYLYPEAPADSLAAFLSARFPGGRDAEATRIFRDSAPDAFDLHDRAYVARLHPLELWTARHLLDRPSASWSETVAAGAQARQDAYRWLFRTRSVDKQNTRIRVLVEEDAFRRMHADWARFGYPFDSLVPSYATSIGSSADRPAALAELLGIVVNDGVRRASRRLTRLRFAAGTPFETVLEYEGTPGERVLAPETARAVRGALISVVESGTARRIAGVYRHSDGTPIAVGGKTGTGDHRFERFRRGGTMIESRVVSRSGTFVFLMGDRFFGNVTVFVQGPEAAGYGFTSSLPVQLLASLEPILRPLVAGGDREGQGTPAVPDGGP